MADADYTDLRGSRRPRKFTLTGKLFPGEPHLHADARWVVQVIDVDTGETKCIDLAKLHAWDGRVAQAVPDALAAVTADRDRLERERDEAVAQARRDALEEAARIAEEYSTAGYGEHRNMVVASNTSTEIAALIRAAALASRTGGRADG